ncbi:hypothetical protein ACIA8O_05955 [Kitasatospora sp. NPDC051853]|uniref:hypothetical protein n=1 Tax=Kitasatospora sp. NPDC051853 TaxID=3364058 RepID=UPI00378D9D48
MSDLGTDARDGGGEAGWGRDAGRDGRWGRAGGCAWLVVMVPLAAVAALLLGVLAIRFTCFGDVVGPWLVISGVLWLALAGGLALSAARSERMPWGSLAVLALLTALLFTALQAAGPLPLDDCYGNVP